MGGTLRARLASRQPPQPDAATAQPEAFAAGARAKLDAADTRAFLARLMQGFADGIIRFGPAGAAPGHASQVRRLCKSA